MWDGHKAVKVRPVGMTGVKGKKKAPELRGWKKGKEGIPGVADFTRKIA